MKMQSNRYRVKLSEFMFPKSYMYHYGSGNEKINSIIPLWRPTTYDLEESQMSQISDT